MSGPPHDRADLDDAVLGHDAHQRLPAAGPAGFGIDHREHQRIVLGRGARHPLREFGFVGRRVLEQPLETLVGARCAGGAVEISGVAGVERFETHVSSSKNGALRAAVGGVRIAHACCR